jgi:hypothetical protein
MGVQKKSSVKHPFLRVYGKEDDLEEVKRLEKEIDKKFYKMSRKEKMVLAYRKFLR